jgi:hypothetical protein
VGVRKQLGEFATFEAKVTLDDFAREWWKRYASTELARKTQERYASIWDLHVLPRLGARQVGDRLMFVTDGMLERDAAGMNIAAVLTAGIDMHAREAVQHLTQAVLQASGGQLRDEATALCLDWHGGPPRDREATSGANREGRLDQAASA